MSKRDMRTKVKHDLEYYESLSLVGSAWALMKGLLQILVMFKDFLFVVASAEKIKYSESYYAKRLSDDDDVVAKSKRKPNFFDE